MKKLLCALFLIPVIVSAQETAAPEIPVHNHEFGINLFSATELQLPNDFQTTSAYFNPAGGLFYKFHFGKNALRASIDYRQHVNFQQPVFFSESSYQKASITRTADLQMGYERAFSSGKFQPFVYGDLLVSLSDERGKETWYGCFGSGENVPFEKEQFSFGLAAGAGIRYNACEHFSISLETGASGFYGFTQYPISSNHSVFGDWGYKLNPVNRLGLSWQL